MRVRTAVGSSAVLATLVAALVAFAGGTAPRIGPDELNAGAAIVAVQCPLCPAAPLAEARIPPGSPTGALEVRCNRCRRLIDYYPLDEQLRFRRPPWFLRGLRARAAGRSLATIWAFARDPRRVRYAEDARRFGHPDVWQLASSTIRLRAGDCEDYAILLADLLSAAGFAPRVVVGEVIARGRRPSLHAWVELTVDGVDYLLDPTPGAPMPTRTPPRARLGAGVYSANLEFDARGLWLRLRDGVIPGALEPADWKRIEQETE